MRLGYLNGSDAEMWSKRAMALMCCQCKTLLLILCLVFLLELIRIGSEENSPRNEFYSGNDECFKKQNYKLYK